MNKKILHLAPDEKFIDRANQIFKLAFPDTLSEFYIVTSKPLKHVSKDDNVFKIDVSLTNQELPNFNLDEYEYVFLHYWLSLFTPFVLKNRNFKKFVWIIWGGDLYNNELEYELYGKYTRKYVNNIKLLSKIKRLILFRGLFKNLNDNKYKAINLLFSVAVLYKEEFDAFKSIVTNNSVKKHIRFFYYPLEYMHLVDAISGDNILIGNSGTVTNNHFEVFNKLKNINLNDRKIIVPLNYGNERYTKTVLRKGKSIFKTNFNPLIEFLPLSQYNKLINTCRIVIMNHYRQQAVGNIITCLYSGAKVYLNHRSSVYNFLKRIDIAVFSFEDEFIPSNTKTFEPLSMLQVDNNRRILNEYFSLKTTISNLRIDLKLESES